MNPFQPFFDHQGVVILDGGLATALESKGHDLADPLWSARLLVEDPEAVSVVHREYLEAGADCIATVTYQATIEGFMDRGLTSDRAEELFAEAVRIATDERDAFWADEGNRTGRLRPLVAASVGPYGAFLADGSEYTGRYDLNVEALEAFHRRRWELLAGTEADVLACETVPSLPEVRALLELLGETPERWAWISLQCRDGAHLADGSDVREAAALCDEASRVAGVGINCVPPDDVSPLLERLGEVTTKPLLAYPNSGEVYDGTTKRWGRGVPSGSLSERATEWHARGARILGGCCRTDAGQVQGLRGALVGLHRSSRPE